MTRVLRISAFNIDLSLIREAAEVIREGGLVAFPTETVYGIGANAFDKKAVRKIFISKVRSKDKPLSVCVAGLAQLRQVVSSLPDEAEVLIKAFLPGPLTLILPKRSTICGEVTGQSGGVGVRFPDHGIALALIKESGVPVATTSANVSGGIDARTAREVMEQLQGKIDLLIDGGQAKLGVPSTIADFTCCPYRILREGAISKEELDRVLRDRGFATLEIG
jgi:L-threonylcarbamoyladenylate synthase